MHKTSQCIIIALDCHVQTLLHYTILSFNTRVCFHASYAGMMISYCFTRLPTKQQWL